MMSCPLLCANVRSELCVQPHEIPLQRSITTAKTEVFLLTHNHVHMIIVSMKRRVRQVAVSSILHREHSEELEMNRRQVNRLIEIGLRGIGIDFITHDNMDETHLDDWGLHLNFRGGNVLANNLINFLNEI